MGNVVGRKLWVETGTRPAILTTRPVDGWEQLERKAVRPNSKAASGATIACIRVATYSYYNTDRVNV